MRRALTLLVWAILWTAVGTAAWAAGGAWLGGSKSPWDRLLEWQRDVEHGRDLEELAQGYARRMQRKVDIARSVIAGNLTLRQAAALYSELDLQWPTRNVE